ncbi:MAG: insulinase family protein [Clostridia bacterium]|nr:insulinase family protein [Clostridia bacterium]
MKRTEFFSALLHERYCRIDHDSGLQIYVFPKKMTTSYALFATRYGSLDRAFAADGGAPEELPDGVAHFLEHKLFDNADGSDAFAQFSALGADANAYTTYNRTAYLFSTTEHFYKSLGELLSFVTHPHFTKASVKKEQGIIAEEIRMYDDMPWERVFQNLLLAMYRGHPVRRNVCGTVASIKKITPELLYRAHELFYAPDNMVLVVCGDVDADEVLAVADRTLTAPTSAHRVERLMPDEPAAVEKSYIEARMSLSKPIFSIGIKDDTPSADPVARARREFAMTLLNEVLFSQSGTFYHTLFEEGLITPSFAHGYSADASFAFNCITGESDRPEEVLTRFWAYVERVKDEGLSDEDVERARRVLYADEIRAYDSTEEIANRLLSFVLDGIDMFDVPEWIRAVSREELEELMRALYRRERTALSVIYPLDGEGETE